MSERGSLPETASREVLPLLFVHDEHRDRSIKLKVADKVYKISESRLTGRSPYFRGLFARLEGRTEDMPPIKLDVNQQEWEAYVWFIYADPLSWQIFSATPASRKKCAQYLGAAIAAHRFGAVDVAEWAGLRYNWKDDVRVQPVDRLRMLCGAYSLGRQISRETSAAPSPAFLELASTVCPASGMAAQSTYAAASHTSRPGAIVPRGLQATPHEWQPRIDGRIPSSIALESSREVLDEPAEQQWRQQCGGFRSGKGMLAWEKGAAAPGEDSSSARGLARLEYLHHTRERVAADNLETPTDSCCSLADMAPALHADILSIVFDDVDFQTIWNSCRTSRQWRWVARNHRTYWKKLEFDAKTMTAGSVELFLDRLNSKKCPHALISLSLRIPATISLMSRHVAASIVLPAMREHLHRAEELSFYVTPAFTTLIWPMFEIDVPNLRNLVVVMIDYDRPGPGEPIPALFQAHTHQSLERVVLDNYPLSPHARPLRHTLKSVEARFGGSDVSCIPALLAWLPLVICLDVWNPSCSGPLFGIPRLTEAQLQSLQHLIVYDENYLAGMRVDVIPTLTLRTFRPINALIQRLVPKDGPLAICFTHSVNLTSGSVVIATMDGTLIRVLQRLRGSYMTSDTFLNDVVVSDRLVVIAIFLDNGFQALCRLGYTFPCLDTLRLFLDGLPRPVPGWKHGAITCHALRTLILQRDIGYRNVRVSHSALQGFARRAFVISADTVLRVIAEDGEVRITEPWGDLASTQFVIEYRTRTVFSLNPYRHLDHPGLEWMH
ncbi:hypothetical protein AURDEDRAFT_124046 [Auricularia subglabra TFB-10046 SS5]|nr:hypothetical protein AURDEDRAFT_124046 [Auricularia subglabra TFB-10046 SS5]